MSRGVGPSGPSDGAGVSGETRVVLPSSREALATFGASILSLVAGYLVLFTTEQSGWLGVVLAAAGVLLFLLGVRAAASVQRHYAEGGVVPASARALLWMLGAVAGAGALGFVLLAVSVVVSMG